MDFIRRWIKFCGENHTDCLHTLSQARTIDPESAPLPRRCLKLTTHDDQIGITLQETAGERGSYVTLSHRWKAATESSRTTKHNYHDRLAGRSLDQLPQLFKDVASVAARIGVQYAWIDSLCIIQDSDNMEDFSQEALKMGDYYQYSALTVVAASGDDRLLPAPLPPTDDPHLVRLPYRDSTGAQKGWFYVYPTSERTSLGRTDNSLSRAYDRIFSDCDIMTRGWVYQEMCLSPRLAFFTPTGLFLQCRSQLPQTEFGRLVPNPEDIMSGGVRHREPLLFRNIHEASESWRRLVTAYSPLRLTNAAQDRLFALAGIATEFQAAVARTAKPESTAIQETRGGGDGDPDAFQYWYVAGHWVGMVHESLLWEEDYLKEAPVTRQRIPGISTWSWASMQVPVRWREESGSLTPTSRLIGIISAQNEFHAIQESSNGDFSNAFIGLETSGSSMSAFSTGRPRDHFGVNTAMATLVFRGKLHPVLIRNRFCGSGADVDSRRELFVIDWTTAACETRRGSYNRNQLDSWVRIYEDDLEARQNANGQRAWRKVCLPFRPNTVVGWVAIEHVDFQNDEAFRHGQVIYALPLSESRRWGGWRVGITSHYYRTYGVLFVKRREGDDCFERVGVGRLCGLEVERSFSMAVERLIKLV